MIDGREQALLPPRTSSSKQFAMMMDSRHNSKTTSLDVGNNSTHSSAGAGDDEHESTDVLDVEEEQDVEEEKKYKTKQLAGGESKAVFGLRLLVIGVMLCSMIGVALAVYFSYSDFEQSEFVAQYEHDSSKVLQSIGLSFEMTLGAMDMLVVSMISHARATNQSWPFVTIPDFACRAEKTLRMTNIYFLDVYPVVTADQREEWGNFTAANGLAYINNTDDFMVRSGEWEKGERYNYSDIQTGDFIWEDVVLDNGTWLEPQELDPEHAGPFMPRWQGHAPYHYYPWGWDYLTGFYNESMLAAIDTHKVVLGDTYVDEDVARFFPDDPDHQVDATSQLIYPILEESIDYLRVHDDSDDISQSRFLGALTGTVIWSDWMASILPGGSVGIRVYLEDACGSANFTYQINGPRVQYLGSGDHREPQYEHMAITVALFDLHEHTTRTREFFEYTGLPANPDHCPFTVHVSPSSVMEESFTSNMPAILAVSAALIFVFSAVVFATYDWCVERRQRIVLRTAVRNSAVVDSMFPKNVREQLLESHSRKLQEERAEAERRKQGMTEPVSNSLRGSSLFQQKDPFQEHTNRSESGMPIAELYPEATVLFGDLAGFTSWSSSRQPSQVFVLLETLYGAFDRIAKRRKVFKIETIGDCYVAVTGLPVQTTRHALNMARFAADIIQAMNMLTLDLELRLGPGTQDLRLRIGLHSGAVTAGVLRGEKARFQLFGDTVNTAARMESNGQPGRIHCSQKTASILIDQGKQDWITQREGLIEAKGKGKGLASHGVDSERVLSAHKGMRVFKGKMQTYWVAPVMGRCAAFELTERSSYHTFDYGLLISAPKLKLDEAAKNDADSKQLERMVDWNLSLFEEPLKLLFLHRSQRGIVTPDVVSAEDPSTWHAPIATSTVRDELSTAIGGLVCEARNYRPTDGELDDVALPSEITQQLRTYVLLVANNHNPNAFHNFDHGCHVTMSTKKMLEHVSSRSKTAAASGDVLEDHFDFQPLVQVGVLMAALVHDVSHCGVSNAQLIREDAALAKKYNYRSVAEQYSLDVAWTLFMKPEFKALRLFLFATPDDLLLFRKVLVNAVLATDIFDPELRRLRDDRWEGSFASEALPSRNETGDSKPMTDTRATAVLEYVIQASDISHTMQHWTIYQKWNRMLFNETYGSFVSGRTKENPSAGWYDGELWFFDNYVIPLAKKLKQCDVLGALSHEFFDCAIENRQEWEEKGRLVVQDMKESFKEGRAGTVAAFSEPKEGLVVAMPSLLTRSDDDPQSPTVQVVV